MFSNTAYEAMYQYIGLSLHEKFIEVITSQSVFRGILILTFGILFFLTTLQFFSRYLPGALIQRRSVPLSKYVKIVLWLFIGISLLRVGGTSSVKKFNGESWHTNRYIKVHMVQPEHTYKVSFIFELLSGTAEEISALISRVIDKVFASANSQLDTPDFFFKAIMMAGASTVDDPKLNQMLKFYTNECFDRLLPHVKQAAKDKRLDGIFAKSPEFDHLLSDIMLETPDKKFYSCLDLKNQVRTGLWDYQKKKVSEDRFSLLEVAQYGFKASFMQKLTPESLQNLVTSSRLANFYLDQHEGPLGIQKGSMIPTPTGVAGQYLNRLFGWDGFLGFFGGEKFQGAALAASRAKEFSENLARAPHLAGFIKMLIIASFPWLVFFVVAGYWRVLFYWFLMYLSVLLWTPIWTLLYHIMVGITQSADVLQAFDQLGDGLSMYGAELVTSRIYHLYAVYSWLQILTGTLFTGMLFFFIRPALQDTKQESAPEFIGEAADKGMTATKVAGAVL
jgi:hypothetical protein